MLRWAWACRPTALFALSLPQLLEAYKRLASLEERNIHSSPSLAPPISLTTRCRLMPTKPDPPVTSTLHAFPSSWGLIWKNDTLPLTGELRLVTQRRRSPGNAIQQAKRAGVFQLLLCLSCLNIQQLPRHSAPMTDSTNAKPDLAFS